MTHRTFDEQIANFNRVVSSWDINQEYKVALLGMIASLGYEHEKSITPEPHWIPVDLENNKPPLEEWVLVSSDGYVMQDSIVERGGKKIWYHGGNIQADDRYMPLPEPYKGVTT